MGENTSQHEERHRHACRNKHSQIKAGQLERLDWSSDVNIPIMFYKMERRSLSPSAASLKAMFRKRIALLGVATSG